MDNAAQQAYEKGMPTESQRRMSAPPTPETLREIGLFGALSDDVLEYLATSLPVELIAPGEAVFREGDQAREMFVVLGGECEVLKRGKRGGEARVALLGPGDWFGEMSKSVRKSGVPWPRSFSPKKAVLLVPSVTLAMLALLL